MPVSLLVRTYSPRTTAGVREILFRIAEGTRYVGQEELIFRICDELLKNAIKANYQFLLTWLAARRRLMEGPPDMTVADADEWLSAVFFAGEQVLLEKQLQRIPDFDRLQTRVRRVLDLENELLKHRRKAEESGEHATDSADLFGDFRPMLQLKRLARQLSIQVSMVADKTQDEILIRVENDAPIRERDVERIRNVRVRYREYHERGEPHMFFVEHLDTSGGGHGLGYALMDSVLLDMGLDPDRSLYLVPHGKTMVLLALPLR